MAEWREQRTGEERPSWRASSRIGSASRSCCCFAFCLLWSMAYEIVSRPALSTGPLPGEAPAAGVCSGCRMPIARRLLSDCVAAFLRPTPVPGTRLEAVIRASMRRPRSSRLAWRFCFAVINRRQMPYGAALRHGHGSRQARPHREARHYLGTIGRRHHPLG